MNILKKTKLAITIGVGLLGLTVVAGSAQAGLIWGNSAGGSVVVEAFNPTTGAVVNQFPGSSGNGRGVVVVGNTVYWTMVGDSNIHKMNANTGASLGSIATSNASMSTLAWDGSAFWTSDYAGTNRAFRIDPLTGTNISTINLSLASNYMDGMEYFNGKLISNRCDACGIYDIYDLSGNVLTNSFINTGSSTTGIAFDGVNFFVSDIYANQLKVYNGTTGSFIQNIALGSPQPGTGYGRLIEDLSVDYAARADTCGQAGQPPCTGGQVPEPASLALLGIGLAGLARMRRRS